MVPSGTNFFLNQENVLELPYFIPEMSQKNLHLS